MRPLGKTSNPSNRKTENRNFRRLLAEVSEHISAALDRRRSGEQNSVFLGVSAHRAKRVWKRLSYGLFLAVFIYGMITGGHIRYGLDLVVLKLDEVVRDAGFSIANVEVVGQKYVRKKDILTVLGAENVSLVRFNTQQAREKIEELEWVESARVMRFFPSTVKVVINERTPYALWQTRGQYFLIDTKGVVIREQKVLSREVVSNFPLIVGDGADIAASKLFNELRKYPRAVRKLKAALRVANRRWTLRLQNGVEILLPEEGVSAALTKLSLLEKQYGILSGGIEKIDLRLPDRITLRRFKKERGI
ncbi:MAG: cell division protein FtsQ/DivIB [Methyloligellaceae bacterium]